MINKIGKIINNLKTKNQQFVKRKTKNNPGSTSSSVCDRKIVHENGFSFDRPIRGLGG